MKRIRRIGTLAIIAAAASARAEWPTPWSGTLPRPILFVHGIWSDAGGWGAVQGPTYKAPSSVHISYCNSRANEEEIQRREMSYTLVSAVLGNVGPVSGSTLIPDAIRKGLISKYEGWPDGWGAPSASLIAWKYGAFRAYNSCEPEKYINHNGLEFYTSLEPNSETPAPFAPLPLAENGVDFGERSQTRQLYKRLVAVLDEYYPDWKTNPSRKIDLVCHSQGGLVARSVIASYRSPGLDNPVNHIHHLVTMGTPHLGTAMATDDSRVPTMSEIRKYVYGLDEKISLDGGRFTAATKLGPYYLWIPRGPTTNGTFIGVQFSRMDEYKSNYLTLTMQEGRQDYRAQQNVIMFDPFVELRLIWNEFTSTDHFLAYPKFHTAGAWEPATSSMATSEVGGASRSDFVTWLRSQPYPSRPFNNSRIPITAFYGRATGLAVDLVNASIEVGYDVCDGDGRLFSPDNVSWLGSRTGNFLREFLWQDGEKMRSCSEYVTRLKPIMMEWAEKLDRDWSQYSDFIVDVSSQKAEGLFRPDRHPFRARGYSKRVQHIKQIHIGRLWANGHVRMWEDLVDALRNPPADPLASQVAIRSLLLQ